MYSYAGSSLGKQFTEGMLLLEDGFFLAPFGYFLPFSTSKERAPADDCNYRSPWWSNEEEEASGGVQQVGVTGILQSAFSFSPGILQGPVESPSLLLTQASQVKSKVLKSTHGVKTNL